MGLPLRKRLSSAVGNTLIILLIVYILAPFLWMIIASFQGENELLKRPPSIIPQNPTLDNYRYVFTGEIPTAYEVKGQLRSRISQEARLIAPALKNSFVVSIVVMVINLLIGTPAAYTFARLNLRGKALWYNFILGSRLMPLIAVAIPYYVIIKNLKLLDTYMGLVLIYCALTLPFTIWFLSLYIANIPREMEDAALVDGCTPFQALVKIAAPLMAPGLIAASAFAFMTSYNEFLFARLITQSIKSQTGPVIIASVAGNPDASYTLISVCITLGLIPPLILAITMRKWLTEGLSASITLR
ncbi:MAG: sugar ABC transporter, permease protein [Anaerolineae bacterium]|jgi:multiple sugar transport system permease protein|nr:MAG: sugar ABC transporter, permease protein [Anaerolineae bacterium]